MRRNQSARSLVFAFVVISLFTAVARGATFTWSGGGTTSFSDPLNWSPSVPTSNNGTDMVFNNNINTTGLVQDIASTMIFNSINFGASAGAFSLGGGTYNVDNNATISVASSTDQT